MAGLYRKFSERLSAARIVPLTPRDLEDANRLLKLLRDSPDASCLGPLNGPEQIVSAESLLDAACLVRMNRRRRLDYFPEAMFGEPAWDILLLLYVERQGKRYSIGRLADELGLPQSSTGRWVNYLQDRKFAQRKAHPTDQRAVFVELTDKGVQALEAYLSGSRPLGPIDSP